MATVELARPANLAVQHGAAAGLWSWLTTTDHKRIGLLYIITTLGFFLLGGLLALTIRIQLALPAAPPLSPETYNGLFTVHGSLMIFLFVIPILSGGFGNYLVPLMIGARDMAFPKLNAMSFWLLPPAGLLLLAAFFVGAPVAGWTAYPPLAEHTPYGQTLWLVAVIILGASSVIGGVNFLVTIIGTRCGGMTLYRMPLFVWAMLVTAFLQVTATPVVVATLLMQLLDREWGTSFFDPASGANILGYQNGFWFYPHPAIYIMILPAFGIIAEVLPVFSRKPIFGYRAIAYSFVAIGVLSVIVWASQVLTAGLPVLGLSVLMLMAMASALPTGVIVLNWIATLWDGQLDFKAPLRFAVGFLTMFVIGGLNGMVTAIVPIDWQLHDTYWVVAHLHYVLFGGSTFGIMAGLYYWFPKVTGRRYSEGLARVHFWLMFIGFNLTFFPMHLLGMLGMQRRIASYPIETGFLPLNVLATAGAFLLGFSVLVMLINFRRSLHLGTPAGPDPWQANTLEWLPSSPPPAYNFGDLPSVESERPLRDLRLRAVATATGLPVSRVTGAVIDSEAPNLP